MQNYALIWVVIMLHNICECAECAKCAVQFSWVRVCVTVGAWVRFRSDIWKLCIDDSWLQRCTAHFANYTEWQIVQQFYRLDDIVISIMLLWTFWYHSAQMSKDIECMGTLQVGTVHILGNNEAFLYTHTQSAYLCVTQTMQNSDNRLNANAMSFNDWSCTKAQMMMEVAGIN